MSYPANPPPYPGPQQEIPMAQYQPVAGAQMVPIVVAPTIGPSPAPIVCNSCQYQVMTRTDASPSFRTHIWAACLFILGCWPCMWIPYCTPACMNVNHYCPNCNAYIGKFPS